VNPFNHFLLIFTDDEHIRSLSYNEVPQLIGNSVDEFMRHHPSLKESVMGSIMKMVNRVVCLVEESSPSIEESSVYFD
jgi:E3 ubiquitin-protein ligase HUWE1